VYIDGIETRPFNPAADPSRCRAGVAHVGGMTSAVIAESDHRQALLAVQQEETGRMQERCHHAATVVRALWVA